MGERALGGVRQPKSAAAQKPEVPVHLKAWLTVPEVMAMTGLGESSIYQLVRDGELRKVPHTERVLIARAELDRFAGVGGPA